MRKTTPPEVRFWRMVQKTDGCWEWTGSKDNGYGHFYPNTGRIGQYMAYAHRYSYQLLVGPIPDKMTIDHLCRNRGCVNPGHMEIVTRGENVLRGDAPTAKHARKTHCKMGHPLIRDTRKRPGRHCPICERQYQETRKRSRRPSATICSSGEELSKLK